ncbi:MAG TPA: O-antigen ligase family protein [Telluria sp.]|nr:O-antigen ligase family protein [Telluria sp.]
MAERSGDRAGAAAGILMFALPALALTTTFGVMLVEVLVLLATAWLWNKGLSAFYAIHARAIRMVVIAFAGYFLVSLARLLVFRDDLHILDGPSRMMFALSCIGFVGLLRPPIRWFWLGLCIGTIGAAAIGLWQWLDLGMDRVDGLTHHPITFGDLSVAMGVMSLCAWSEFRNSRLAFLPFVALVCGVLASIVSGSRGAWLGLLLVLPPLLKYGSAVHGKRLAYGVGAALAFSAIAYAVPATEISRRVDDAVSEVQRYAATRDATTHVGVRLELWRASLMMIAEHPWIGVGRDGFHPALLELARQGRVQQSPALIYSSSHNDVLHTLSTGGVLDFSFLMLMYGAPLAFFWKKLHSGAANAAPALAGLLLVVCFIGFGLTDVMFWLMIPKAFYAMMVCALTGFCLANDAQSAARPTE